MGASNSNSGCTGLKAEPHAAERAGQARHAAL